MSVGFSVRRAHTHAGEWAKPKYETAQERTRQTKNIRGVKMKQKMLRLVRNNNNVVIPLWEEVAFVRDCAAIVRGRGDITSL